MEALQRTSQMAGQGEVRTVFMPTAEQMPVCAAAGERRGNVANSEWALLDTLEGEWWPQVHLCWGGLLCVYLAHGCTPKWVCYLGWALRKYVEKVDTHRTEAAMIFTTRVMQNLTLPAPFTSGTLLVCCVPAVNLYLNEKDARLRSQKAVQQTQRAILDTQVGMLAQAKVGGVSSGVK